MRGLMAGVLGVLVLLVAACGDDKDADQARRQEPEPPAPPVTAPQPRASFTAVSFATLPGWTTDRVADALPAFARSCRVFLRQAETQPVGRDGQGGTAADWQGPCRAAERLTDPSDDTARAFFETWFDPWRVDADGASEGTFTGYYEAELNGSRRRGGVYQTPILGRPGDLVTVDLGQFRPELKHEVLVGRVDKGRLKPYFDRAGIESSLEGPEAGSPEGRGVGGRGEPLLWVDDPADAFLLHIQGSGVVHLDDGTEVRVGYAADNGHRFVPIARRMIDRGLLAGGKADMIAVRAWLRENPAEARVLMAENPRYIFFRLVEADGPLGAFGVPLTARRSLAIDPRHLPLGVPVWLDTRDPEGVPLQRLVMAQDTGSAITGPVRGDFFWGHGEAALVQAGRMKSKGRYFLLLPKTRTGPLA